MDKDELTKKIMVYIVAGSIAAAPVSSTLAETKYKQGIFFQLNEENEENKPFTYYVVKKGDYLSKICRRICLLNNEPVSNDWWPAIAFLNDFPRVLQPGDVIRFYTDFNKNIELDQKLRDIGWTRRYIKENDVYGKRKRHRVSINKVGELLYDIYGNNVCVDEDFIRLFLDATGLSSKYELSENDDVNEDLLYDFTESLRPLDELYEYRQNNKQKTKKLR